MITDAYQHLGLPRFQSPQATPCPFWRCPVPDVVVISAKRLPARFLNMRLGMTRPNDGSPGRTEVYVAAASVT